MINNDARNHLINSLRLTDTDTFSISGNRRVADGWRGENFGSDEEEDSWDDDEDSNTSSALVCREELSGPGYLRMERVREILATEQEYVKDLKALLQTAEGRETTIVQLHVILGNMKEVVNVAEQLVQGLEEANKGISKEQQLGHLFLHFAEKLSQVYQEYCSHYSVHVLTLLKKYEETEEGKAELANLTEDLQSMRPHILSVNTALIKPVQRILRYPLYLNHLLEDTPSSHPDFLLLQEAHIHLSDVATQINEYTRGLGLVFKYQSEDDHSLHAKMRRVSLHSLAKKSVRMSMLLSQRIGIMSQSACVELEKEEAKFHCIQDSVVALVNHTKNLLEAVRARHSSEMLISMAIGDILHAPYVEAIKKATMESYCQALKTFEREVKQRVLLPTSELAILCQGPSRLIQKRHQKKLDYDAAHAIQAVKHEGICTDKAKGFDKQGKVKVYEALQSLLLTELPVLTHNAQMMIVSALCSLAAARLYLQGHMAHIYLQLIQVENFPYIKPKAAQEIAQKQVEWLLMLLPESLQKKYNKDHAGTMTIRKKYTMMKTRRKSLPAEYFMGSTHTQHASSLQAPIQLKASTFHIPLHQSEETHEKANPKEELQQATCLYRTHEENCSVDHPEFHVVSDLEKGVPTRSALPTEGSTLTSSMPNTFQAAREMQHHKAKNMEVETYIAQYAFTAQDETQLSLKPGQRVVPLLKARSGEWWFVKAESGKQGYIPAAYVTPFLG